MRGIIQFQIYKGDKQYVASGVDVAIVTQAKTLDKLAQNIKEAVTLHFEGEDLKKMGFTQSPSVLMNFEIPAPSYA